MVPSNHFQCQAQLKTSKITNFWGTSSWLGTFSWSPRMASTWASEAPAAWPSATPSEPRRGGCGLCLASWQDRVEQLGNKKMANKKGRKGTNFTDMWSNVLKIEGCFNKNYKKHMKRSAQTALICSNSHTNRASAMSTVVAAQTSLQRSGTMATKCPRVSVLKWFGPFREKKGANWWASFVEDI